jgi:hypothetical protein
VQAASPGSVLEHKQYRDVITSEPIMSEPGTDHLRLQELASVHINDNDSGEPGGRLLWRDEEDEENNRRR